MHVLASAMLLHRHSGCGIVLSPTKCIAFSNPPPPPRPLPPHMPQPTKAGRTKDMVSHMVLNQPSRTSSSYIPPTTPSASLQGLHDLNCEIIIWTASDTPWGTYVVSQFDPQNFIQHKLYRDRSWWDPAPAVYTKDLRRLGRSMDDVVIVENSPSSVWMNKHNAIMVPDYFTDNPKDGALSQVLACVWEIVKRGRPVRDYIPTTPRLHARCPTQSWNALDEARAYHGIGDFPS